MSLNKVMLIGNVGRDPEVRYLENNPAPQGSTNPKVARFTLATTERYRDRNGETRENTEWHNIVAWRGLADLAEKYIRKGSQIYVEGHLRTRSWTDQAGVKKDRTEIEADAIQLLGRRSDNQAGTAGTSGYQQGGYQTQQPAQPSYQQQAPQSYQPAGEPAGFAPRTAAPQPAPAAQKPEASDYQGTDDLPF